MHTATITPLFLNLLIAVLPFAAQVTPHPRFLGNIGNAPPPKLIWTPRPSPQCAAVNGGELQCCRGALAGDQPLIVFLAQLYGYNLNPNDVNGLVCDDQLDKCPGVKMCCQVTALSPLVSLYCQDY
ncbi:hypothetical protein PG999_004562 [Apiospora kogelbergensis]|uniref:Hydrophobin n=1 Tax=Apiospora kogelbergensis TaxID=1337665 RepID=A0AAW0QZN7_9PEZI